MATQPTLKTSFTPSEQDSLAHLSDLLHLIHHRNKNQHRRAIWYRHFQHFRKQLSSLVDNISTLNSVPPTHLDRKRKKSSDDVLRTRMAKRLVLWRDVWVAKWWMVFSQVVAEGRFAVVGVVLVAVLGEVGRVVGVTEGLEAMGEEEVRGVIERFGREMREEEGKGVGGLEERGVGEGNGEDVGVAVARDEGKGGEVRADGVRGAGSETGLEGKGSPAEKTRKRPASPTKDSAESAPKPKKKGKKRKGGNAIDDLFSALG